MTRYTVVYSALAERDILQILDYVENSLADVRAALNVARNIYAQCEALAIFPRVSPVRFRLNGMELRFAHAKKYTIIYYIKEDSKQVIIYMVVYSRRNIDNILKSK